MTPAASATLSLRKVCFAYDGMPVLREASLDVAAGELVALLGPSGCGKTTALKVMAGLLSPQSGDVYFGDERMTLIPAERRRAPMVFQKPLLFPHLQVRDNVAFSLDLQRVPTAEKQRRVEEALALVRLSEYGSRLPKELSGGQEQRVAVARAIVSAPRVLLLDEPFSALDESLRGDLRLLVREVQQRLGITTVFVTHDQREAATMASRIALVLDGRIAQVGPARDFYTKPATLEVARFFGWQTLRKRDGNWLAFRSGDAMLATSGEPAPVTGWFAFPGRVAYCLDLGTHRQSRLELENGDQVDVEGGPPQLCSNAAVTLSLDPGRVVEFRQDTATAHEW